MPENLFSYVIIGLAKLIDQNYRYPYPDELRYSLNVLASLMSVNYPKTMNGLLALFSQPLDKWWPGQLPGGFDPTAELLYDHTLSEEASEFLTQFFEDTNLPRGASLANIQQALDNQRFKQLLKRLQDISQQDKAGSQRTYITIRRFLIEHPWTTTEMLGDTFGDLRYVDVAEVGDLYMDVSDLGQQLLHHNGQSQPGYWNCPHCGPLYTQHQQLVSLKPSSCGQHCPGSQRWQSIPIRRGLRVLRKGIHLRTHLPGILEIKLYNWLAERKEDQPDHLTALHLWPDLDRYDLQITFADEVWAIDLKDYKDPYQLGRKIKGDTLYNQGDLRWQQGFYVFPAYRKQQRSDYRVRVLQEANPLPPNIHILSDEDFKVRVTNKLKGVNED